MIAAAPHLASGPLGLARAWALIGADPTAATGLHDRGRIAPGLHTDLVLLDLGTGEIVATPRPGTRPPHRLRRIGGLGADG